MKRERISQMAAVLHAPVEQVWNVVTDNTDWSWRSDLCAIKEKPRNNQIYQWMASITDRLQNSNKHIREMSCSNASVTTSA